MNKIRKGTRLSLEGWLFVAPLLLLLAVFILYPVIMNFYYGFTAWKGFGQERWIGLDNYAKMMSDAKFWTSIGNTVALLLFIPVSTLVTLGVAALLRDGVRGWTIFRSLLYIPNLLGVVIVGTAFNLLLRDAGPINTFLSSQFGFSVPWLTSPVHALLETGFISVVWSPLGFGIIYFLAAMSHIDPSLYESAAIDGAGRWAIFRHITIPSIRFSVEFWIVMSFINVFGRMFGFIYVFSRGGPGFSTFTLEYGIYELAFNKFDPSYSSAWSTVLFIFCAFISVAQIRLMKRNEA